MAIKSPKIPFLVVSQHPRPLLVCRCFSLAATSYGGGWSDSSESILTGWASGDGEERRVWCLEKARSMPARWSSAMAVGGGRQPAAQRTWCCCFGRVDVVRVCVRM
ncbi:auxin response factor 11 [Striga asiatica]|uniref:Auxin response factor 11 n=1 Tax=Striga asiatica TaxID=4170 RepID=A0A5A7PTX4_STRAF|nr:auxin response factor 11 [Striga asiatica]